jgi:hypothetical protein
VEITPGLRQDTTRFLAAEGGTLTLLLDACGGAQPPETQPTGAAPDQDVG